jgi:parvulin-like peptidyl-prolyl isomerase
VNFKRLNIFSIARLTIVTAIALVGISASGTLAQPAKSTTCMTRFGQKEWAILTRDVPADKKKELLDDKQRLKEQAANMRELLALSCEAVKRGLANEPTNKTELGSIKSEVVGVAYDTKIRKEKSGAPFAWITDAQVEKYYLVSAHAADFDRFLEAKLELLRRSTPGMATKVATEEERKSAREFFAKIKISEGIAATLPPLFQSETAFQVRMQQAQFLARIVAEALTADLMVTDEDVMKYIAAHPEFDASAKRSAAAKILARAVAGEDFASLANQYSEDPGNTGPDGKKNGGLYADVPVGMMVPSFEKAALALQPGQIAAGLVESDFGYHVIKLEKKTPDGSKYDVRHILILTGYKDPNDPNAKEVPAPVYVRTKLQNEREDAVMKRIIAQNVVVVEEYNPAAPAPAKRPVGKRRRAG